MKIKSLFALLSAVSLISFNSAHAWEEYCYLTGDGYGGYEWVCPPGNPVPTPTNPSETLPSPEPDPRGLPEILFP